MNVLIFGSPADLFIFVFGSVGHMVSTIKKVLNIYYLVVYGMKKDMHNVRQ